MFSYFVVAIGGALGSVGRFWLSGAIAQRFGETFPAGTLLVNISGSLIIGFFAALTGPDGRIWASPNFRQFFMIGVLGGYTTFSSFSLQTLTLARDGEWLFATLNALGSLVLCSAGGLARRLSRDAAQSTLAFFKDGSSTRFNVVAHFHRRKRSL
jgi:fluoride exporter